MNPYAIHAKYPCTIPGCDRPRLTQHPHCRVHGLRLARYGTAGKSTANGNSQGKPTVTLSGTQRRPYIFSTLAILRKRIKAKDAHLIQLLHELTGLFKCRIERLRLHDWISYKPQQKAHAILWNIWNRWPHDQDAALFVVGTVIGTLYALKLYPGLEKGHTFTTFQLMRAISSLMRPDVIHSPAIENGRGGMVTPKPVKARPRPTGRYVVGHLIHLIVSPIQFYVQEAGKDFEFAVLKHLLEHHDTKHQRAIQYTRRQLTNYNNKKKKKAGQ